MGRAGDRLSAEQLRQNFKDLPPALSENEVLIEAARCLYCYDAPCVRACPTHIDVPKFIRQIHQRNSLGAAKTILESNVFGGSCARACPTEVLCEGACVDNLLEAKPVAIGRLQRHACDTAAAKQIHFFQPGLPTGKKIAIVGSGPAGLTCAHELRKHGHDVVVFEARDVPGGLNTLGIAAYKISTEFALAEIEQIRRIGVEIRLKQRVAPDMVRQLLADFDAVFLGVGLGNTLPLGIEGENLVGVWDALEFIFQTHTGPFSDCRIGPSVIVIGAGNTAIDVATAARRLGAEHVTIAYRRDENTMPAFRYEYELAKADGVRFEWCAQPVRILGKSSGVTGVEFVRARPDASRRAPIQTIGGTRFVLAADMVVKALGQEALLEYFKALPGLRIDSGKLAVDRATGATSIPRLFAGGDCIRNGGEVVDAVEDGKIAARGIHNMLIRPTASEAQEARRA